MSMVAPVPADALLVNLFQARKVRLLTAFMTLVAGAASYWAFVQLNAVEPDAAAFVVAPIFCVSALGMHLYSARYATSLRVVGETLEVVTASFGSPVHRIALERLGRRVFHEGRNHPAMRQRVHAPWITLHVDGYRIPFVVDAQAEYLDRSRLERLQPRARKR